ncbi:MAG TPA: gamma carbonic anhydrase family protein [Spirochaetales bacterium]|nr:gamma carbonic anhydrase family protein [Spirochaetales bacterium]
MVHKIGNRIPNTTDAAFIAWNAEVSGSIELGKDVSIWFGASVRGDIEPITIQEDTNIQDNATLHTDFGAPCTIGKRVTIGHNAVIHGCTVGDDCLIGMGAVLLSRSEIGKESIVGAGALVTEGKIFPPRSLILGSPAKVVRTLDDSAIDAIRKNSENYIKLAKDAAESYREI